MASDTVTTSPVISAIIATDAPWSRYLSSQLAATGPIDAAPITLPIVGSFAFTVPTAGGAVFLPLDGSTYAGNCLEGVSDALLRFNLAHVDSINVHFSRVTAANVDIVCGVVPSGYDKVRTKLSEQFRYYFQSRLDWRSNVTTQVIADLQPPWPKVGVSASLIGVPNGMRPALLMVAVRNSGADPAASHVIRMEVTLNTNVSGYGAFI
jgi:hypothetical protein